MKRSGKSLSGRTRSSPRYHLHRPEPFAQVMAEAMANRAA
jgi:hypothetical protein